MTRLPDWAVRAPITTASAGTVGLRRREFDGPLWQALGYGVRAWHGLDPDDADVRVAAVVAAQPTGSVIGGWAALRASGVRSFDGWTGPRAERLQPILVHVGPDGRTRPTSVLHVDRGRIDPDDVVNVGGILVMRPTAAVVHIAARYGAEEGLVAADAAWRAGLTSRPELQEYVGQRARSRGIRSARLVAHLADPRAASFPESRLRYVWVVEAGLPVPLVNVTLTDTDGHRLGDPDLLDTEAALVGEYDGAHHRELDNHTRDNAREEGFELRNLVVVRATSIDLWPTRPLLVRRLEDGYRRGLARDRARDDFGLRVHRSDDRALRSGPVEARRVERVRSARRAWDGGWRRRVSRQ